MKHIDSLAELGQIEEAVLEAGVNPKLENSGADAGDWLLISRIQSQLQEMKLMSRYSFWPPLEKPVGR